MLIIDRTIEQKIFVVKVHLARVVVTDKLSRFLKLARYSICRSSGVLLLRPPISRVNLGTR